MLTILRNIFFRQTYRTVAELDADQWLSYRHMMLVNWSNRMGRVR